MLPEKSSGHITSKTAGSASRVLFISKRRVRNSAMLPQNENLLESTAEIVLMPKDSLITTHSKSRFSRRGAVAEADQPLRVLFLSRSYPNNVLKLLGLWVEGLVRHCAHFCECKVISPVPYCPQLPGLGEEYSRFRRVARRRSEGAVDVYHPRFLVPPGNRFHGIEGLPYYFAAERIASSLRSSFSFDLIHAHFSYPDGWVAARLGRKFGTPVIITEQNP